MIDQALSTLDAKIRALEALRPTIDSPDFRAAIETILASPGKLIVSGIGKSGIIARKIVATLVSTGQQATFLHPSEAAHGDMGIIRTGDIALLITNSGRTDELIPVADYCLSGLIPLIVISANPEGRVSLRAHIHLQIPATPEGCPIGKAPMASATSQLAVGDALAAALMVARRFTADDFARSHHGGYLGQQAREKA